VSPYDYPPTGEPRRLLRLLCSEFLEINGSLTLAAVVITTISPHRRAILWGESLLMNLLLNRPETFVESQTIGNLPGRRSPNGPQLEMKSFVNSPGTLSNQILLPLDIIW
jgi:hypothetical protein